MVMMMMDEWIPYKRVTIGSSGQHVVAMTNQLANTHNLCQHVNI